MVKQCEMVKAKGTGTRCMVYRNTELALQWEETSRAAMTQQNVDDGWFLKFKSKAACAAAAPCDVAAFHTWVTFFRSVSPLLHLGLAH